jgi:hypothetical protein
VSVPSRLDLEEAHEVGGLLDVVDDVVELGGEGVDVRAVEPLRLLDVEAPDDLLGDPVSLLLSLEDVAGDSRVLGPGLEHLLEQLRPSEDVGASLREKLEVDRIPACDGAEWHRGPS